MTAQVMDKIIYEGAEYSLASEPLRSYLDTREDIEFRGFTTACYRGYTATWELLNDQLFLIGLSGSMITKKGGTTTSNHTNDKRTNPLRVLFPDSGTKVFASWFTGTVRIPQGDVLQYVHMGYGSLYEKDLIVHLKDGKVVNQEEFDHRKEFSKLSDIEKYKLGQDLKFRS